MSEAQDTLHLCIKFCDTLATLHCTENQECVKASGCWQGLLMVLSASFFQVSPFCVESVGGMRWGRHWFIWASTLSPKRCLSSCM
jgi:hypothetical protein